MRMLVTGFGPFPGVPENPSEALVRAVVGAPLALPVPAVLRTLVLPTEYRRSWRELAQVWRRFKPDVVLHFGVSRRATGIVVETQATRRIDPALPDAVGFVPASGFARPAGPDRRAATIDTGAVLEALAAADVPAELSDDAGLYLCNATLYRSLARAFGTATRIGFIHIPPARPSWSPARLSCAAAVILKAVANEYGSIVRVPPASRPGGKVC